MPAILVIKSKYIRPEPPFLIYFAIICESLVSKSSLTRSEAHHRTIPTAWISERGPSQSIYRTCVFVTNVHLESEGHKD